MANRPLRVGFDLDGVILYNPTRIFRSPITLIKKIFFKKRQLKFFIPQTSLGKFFFRLFHYSSLFAADGLKDVKKLIQENNIKAYLISARFDFLKNDFDEWVKKIDSEGDFSGYFYNKDNEQPHVFKEKMIKKLDLDVFVEDNWDIVHYLDSKFKIQHLKHKVLWIYNILDKKIHYPYKYSSLKQAVKTLSVERSKKKVLIVTDFFLPHWTGIVKSLSYLTNALKSKIEFTVLTVKHKKNLKKEENWKGIKIIRVSYLIKISRAFYSLSMISRFIKEVENYDIIFINSPLSNMLPISLITKLFGKKLLVFHQGDLILPKGIANRLIEKVFDFSALISFILADKVSTYTKDYAENSRVLKFFLGKFTAIIPPMEQVARVEGISQAHSDFSSLPLVASNCGKEIRDRIWNKNYIIFGFAGRFVQEKGFDILLNAIPQVIKKIPNAWFVFAGETNIAYENFYEQNLDRIKKLRKHLTFLGLLKDKDLAQFYQIIDFIVIPSRSDCFNLVQAEAMMFGKPSIAADIPGLRVLVKKTGFGKLFRQGSSDDLAAKIIEAVKQKKLIRKNYSKVLEILDSQKNAQIFEKFITNGD